VAPPFLSSIARCAARIAPVAALVLLSGSALGGIGSAEMLARARRAKVALQKERRAPPPKAPKAPWSSLAPQAAESVERGGPLVTFIVVPLCSNEQIDCGSVSAGRPGDLSKNLYWGAVFGQRRFFDRKSSGWTRVEVTQAGKDDPMLERVIYKRLVPRAQWMPAAEASSPESVEQIVVFQAVHGASIDSAVSLFWTLATEGGRVRFRDGERERDEAIHVAGYSGHNRLMDGIKLPPPPPKERARPIPSFVIACYSEAYFGDALRSAGSTPLVMTRALMAPEGYVLDALTRALGEDAPRAEVRARAVDAYAKWQRLSTGVASGIFAPAEPR
jgi:hypothetical protein